MVKALIILSLIPFSLSSMACSHDEKGATAKKLELKKGDVVTAVNGRQVDSPQKAMQLYQQVKKSGNTVEVIRNKKNIKITN